MATFTYSLMYDFHTMATIPDVGAQFDVEAFTDQLKSCGIDLLTWHARCNQGHAYYNTQVGKRHPALKFDLLREIGDSCHRKGIKLCAYFNGHLSDEELMEHPEWRATEFNGVSLLKSNPLWARLVCYNSSFREHLVKMVNELIEDYPVDGFFFDCLGSQPCICPRCVKEMQSLGMNPTVEKDVNDFALSSIQRYVRYLEEAVHAAKPDALLFFNGRPDEEVAEVESHLECECLPTSMWGYDCLPIQAHYMRTVAPAGKTILNMTGRFNEWSDFGGLRTAEALEYDLLYGIANGMRPNIGGHFHPRGDLDLPVFDRIREVYHKLQQYDKWSLNAVNQPEIALVYPRKPGQHHPHSLALSAAVRMLTELKIQFNLVSEFASWEPYKLLIFPEDVTFTDEIAARVRKHLAKGGKVLATAHSGLTPDGKAFALSELWPATNPDTLPYLPVYFQPAGSLAADLPDMPLAIYASGLKVDAAEGAAAEMFYNEPYLRAEWDGLRSNFYAPPRRVSELPFVLQKGNILYCSGELFTGYAQRAAKQVRQLVGRMIGALLPRPQLRCANFPSFSRVFQQKQGTQQLVHILAYCPECRHNAVIVEDRITLLDGEIALRVDAQKIREVYLAPTRQPLPFTIEEGYCRVTVPRVDGYALVVFEAEA